MASKACASLMLLKQDVRSGLNCRMMRKAGNTTPWVLQAFQMRACEVAETAVLTFQQGLHDSINPATQVRLWMTLRPRGN